MASKKIKINLPSLKSSSGAGFTFEDKAAAVLLCEMLAGVRSLGTSLGIIQKLERQAGDWEPFGDLLLEVPNDAGVVIKCGGSVKSNRQINANGCDRDLCVAMWKTMEKSIFDADFDLLLLLSAPLSASVNDQMNSLCHQARMIDAERLDQKIVHVNVRNIYNSFRNSDVSSNRGLPGHLLGKLIHREFDFESTVSQSETSAIVLCRAALREAERNEELAKELWMRVCEIAQSLRVSGGAISRGGLSAKLRNKFPLLDDPCDTAAWTVIRRFSREGLDEIGTTLPGNITIPRLTEKHALRTAIADSKGCYVLGESGAGKSSLVKSYAAEVDAGGGEVVWIRAERFNLVATIVSHFADVLARCRSASCLLVMDAMEGCITPESLSVVSRLISDLSSRSDSVWSFVLTCQPPEWNRISTGLNKHLSGHAVLTKRVDCGTLEDADFELVCAASASVARLAHDPKIRPLLSTLKMLDVLLAGQLVEDRPIASEADLVEWWWEQQVRGTKQVASEERVARELASRMADELCSELPPNSVAGSEEAASNLIHNRVLRRTRDGLLRFEHELLADWTRVMCLRGLGEHSIEFIRTHTENPPWLRAVRLFSQHLLDRAADLDRWRAILSLCRTSDSPNRDPSAENLQTIDIWLEGIIFSVNSGRILDLLLDELFSKNGWLLRRLLRRLMLVGTIPDPVIQERFGSLDKKSAAAAAARFRLPMWKIWSPVVKMVISHPEMITEFAPIEIAEIAEMWARLEEYVDLKWANLAELVILNAERELRREVAGEYRHDSGPQSLGGGNNSRISIYAGALYASAQFPDRVAKLAAKAAGITAWEQGDLIGDTEIRWLGEWEEPNSMFYCGPYVEEPVQSWTDGPGRETSDDFFHAWFDLAASTRVFKKAPKIACDVTLAFLLAWPKTTLRKDDHQSSSIDHYGFNSEADHMYPPFYSKGPFLAFLRNNWTSGLDLVIRLVNFATERYTDWWPYEPGSTVLRIPTDTSPISWQGNHQVYGWHRFNMNTVQVVTCALMATEKWLEEMIEKGESIALPTQLIFEKGKSLAFGGLLIALGKRNPELFLDEIKPLIFVRDLYMLDMQNARENVGIGWWMYDGEFMNNLRREWEKLPGRDVGLLDLALGWFVSRPKFQPAFNEVSKSWKAAAAKLPMDSEARLPLLRWAANFDLANWKEIDYPDGRSGWQYEHPENLRDTDEAQIQLRRQALLTIPYRCSEWLDKRQRLGDESLEQIWEQLQNWTEFENASYPAGEDEMASGLRDHRNARSGLIAVILCLGGEWLDLDPARRAWIEEELVKILNDPPEYKAFTPGDTHDDCEGFLARSVARCWVHSGCSEDWRGFVGSFVAAYRYRTTQRLWGEVFLDRRRVPSALRDLEGLVLSCAAAKRSANIGSFDPYPERLKIWFENWIPEFAKGRGPKWVDDWEKVEIKQKFDFDRDRRNNKRKLRKLTRRNYGLEMGVLLAAFGSLPRLAEAETLSERKHWLNICTQFLAAYLRTLPTAVGRNDDEWSYDIWESDRKIIKIVASRIFQGDSVERRRLWLPILNLPPEAHHHITQFLSALLIEALESELVEVCDLTPIWREMIEHLFSLPKWSQNLRRRQNEVWKYLFLYGGTVSSVMNEEYAPFVFSLRDLFERHVRAMPADPYDQSSLAAFLVSDAGEQFLVAALDWMYPSWQSVGTYFWKVIVERGSFEVLLQRAWLKYFDVIRRTPTSLQAFKVLTLNLASRQVAAAVEVQRLLGTV